jgi:hypothetical protein
MKRIALVSLAVLCAAALVPQNLDAGVGIKVGYALSKSSVSPTGTLPPLLNLPAPIGGVYFNLKLGPLAIQPEVLYVRMGAKYDYDGGTMEWHFDYIQVPLLLKLSVIPLGPIRPIIYAGGYGAYLIKATGVEVVGGVSGPPVDLIDSYQKYDYGVVGGAGIDFKLPGITLSIEGRYNYGLRNIWITTAPDDTTAWKNRSMMALVGIGF